MGRIEEQPGERRGVLPPGGLTDPGRLESLDHAGVTARPEPEMDRLAERVRLRLGVPTALVTMVEPDRQVFPGMSGLPEPWAGARCTPLSHSFCQYVVATSEPLVIGDAREDPLLRDNGAVSDLGVVAYAGMPLTDGAGRVLGSLCAIDSRPRDWTADELAALRDLAWGCSMWLRLRLAEHDAAQDRGRRDQVDAVLRRSAGRSQMLLRASQAFTDTVTVEDIREQVSALVGTDLAPTYVGMVVLGPDGRIRRVRDPAHPAGTEDTGSWASYRPDAALPTATAIREQRLVSYPDRERFDADHPPEVRALLRKLDLHAVVVVPLAGSGGTAGALALGWDSPHDPDPLELLSISTVAGYAAQALARAGRLQGRIEVVHTLQQAMLTELPEFPGLRLAARYRPADARENVGGDWYDAIPLPARSPGGPARLVVEVGDIVGHDVVASTVMGQVRSMLRQATWDRPDDPPSATLAALEAAAAGVGLEACGSAVLAHLEPTPGRPGGWSMRWSNAGHPPPVLLLPGGRTSLLEAHDAVFGFAALRDRPRHDHLVDLGPGDTLLLYSDGLVERRGQDLDAGIDRLRAVLATLDAGAVEEFVDAIIDRLGGAGSDDVVVLAVHVPPIGDAGPG